MVSMHMHDRYWLIICLYIYYSAKYVDLITSKNPNY
jgi:hypothetical protein